MSTRNRSPRTRVAVAVIARDEEQFIADCLESVRPYIDELVVLDTGSTDRTAEIARAHGARVAQFEWCDDFSAARNAAIDAVTADWILMLDADERLTPESGPLLRQLPRLLPEGCHGYTMRIDSVHVADTGEMVSADKIPRFFPRRSDVRWMGRIHEDLRYIPDPANTRLVAGSGLRAIHYGYDPTVYAQRGKDARNLAILQAAQQADPADARMVFFTAQQHVSMKRWNEAVGFFSDFLEREHALPAAFTVEATSNLLTAQFELRDSAGMQRTADLAAARGALSITSYMALGRDAESRGDVEQALAYYARTFDAHLPTGFTWDSATGGWMTYVRMAMTELHREGFARALELLRQAVDLAPRQQMANLASDALRVAMRAGQPDVAEQWLRLAAERIGDDYDQQLKLAELGVDLARLNGSAEPAEPGSPRLVEQALAREDWQLAYEAVQSLDLASPGVSAHMALVATCLRDLGAPDAALDVLARGIETAAASTGFALLLVQTLRDLGRFDEAIEVLELLNQPHPAESRQHAA